jgi:hypothetical protein
VYPDGDVLSGTITAEDVIFRPCNLCRRLAGRDEPDALTCMFAIAVAAICRTGVGNPLFAVA